MKKLLRKLAIALSNLHDQVHNRTAKVLGVEVSMEGNNNWLFLDAPIWKNLVIYLMPSAIGFIAAFGSFSGYAKLADTSIERYIWGAGVILGFFWLGSCFNDYYEAMFYLIFSRWPDDEKDSSTNP